MLEDRDSRRPDETMKDGRVFRRRKMGPKTVTTLLGSVTYKRARYRTRAAGAARRQPETDQGARRDFASSLIAPMSVEPRKDCSEMIFCILEIFASKNPI